MGFKTLFNIQNKQLQESNNDCVYSCKRGTVYKLEKINPASIEQNNSFAPMLLFFFFFLYSKSTYTLGLSKAINLDSAVIMLMGFLLYFFFL